MKTQILPNWCKKLGLIMFIIFSVIGNGDDIINGSIDGCNENEPTDLQIENSDLKTTSKSEVTFFKDFLGEKPVRYIDALSIFGILIYMLSKEKIEDDYITQLRLESYQFTAILSIIISILLYAFSKEIKLGIDYFICTFMYVYLITFFFKKRIY